MPRLMIFGGIFHARSTYVKVLTAITRKFHALIRSHIHIDISIITLTNHNPKMNI